MDEKIQRLYQRGFAPSRIAERLNTTREHVYRVLHKMPNHQGRGYQGDEQFIMPEPTRLQLVGLGGTVLYSLTAPGGYTFVDLLLAALWMSTSQMQGRPAPWWYDEENEEEIHTAA